MVLGSWYLSSGNALNKQLSGWIRDARGALSNGVGPDSKLCAIIVPHAGYSYSGATAAYAFADINPHDYDRVFVLGPSHHAYLSECLVSGVEELETPIGMLKVDVESRRKLKEGGMQVLERYVEEAEHSIELCLPWIAKVFEERLSQIKVLPVMVGALSGRREKMYGEIFAEWLFDDRCLFVISSDFCHWGSRFGFTPWDRRVGDVWESIEKMDREGMDFIEAQDPDGFTKYHKRTRNTICGRHPIAVLLHAVQFCVDHGVGNPRPLKFDTRFVKYTQSSKCTSTSDSSVSYASALVRVEK